MESDYLVLFGVMQGNDGEGLEGWLKNFIPLLWKRLEGDGYKITILSSSYLFFTSYSRNFLTRVHTVLSSFLFLHINLSFNFSFNLLIKINKILLLTNI